MKKPIRCLFSLVWVFFMSRYRASGLLELEVEDVLVYHSTLRVGARAFSI
jgi:hypothetical protein